MLKYKLIMTTWLLFLALSACQQNTGPTPAAVVKPAATSLSLTASPSPAAVPTVSSEATRLNLVINTEPPTLDLHRTADVAASQVFGFICEPLVYQGLDLADYPLLAKSLPETAADGLSLTVKLRQHITFHDGTPLNAAAVKFTFERLQQPESEASPLYDELKGVKIETPDPDTVVFEFDQPRHNFIETLRSSYAAIISPGAVAANPENFGRQPVCTGPYQLEDWKATQYLLLAKNPAYAWAPAYYKNQGPAKIDELKISFVADNKTRFQALLKGEIDILSLGHPEEVTEIKNLPDKFRLYESWSGGISFLGFNYQRAPLDNPLVRQALAQAIDKQVIVQMTLGDLAEPAFAPLAPSVFGFSPELANFEYKFDPEQSPQLLEKAGFGDSNEDGIRERNGQPLTLEILTTTDDVYKEIFGLIQSQFQKVGVQTTLRQATPAEIAEITPTGQFELLLYHYSWPFPNALELFLGTERIGASNRVGYSNPEVDDLLRQASQQPGNSPEKLTLLLKAQQIILQDAPWQPLLVRKLIEAANKRVAGVMTHPAGELLLHDAYIEP
jgi:peptide/nickel transport system substrate-binding protein